MDKNHKRKSRLTKVGKPDPDFTQQVSKRWGVKFNQCYHCRCCAGGCPFYESMDYPPHGIIRLIQLGMKEQALKSSTIWICVGCNTCSVQCPMAIDIPAVMDAVSQIAIEEKAIIAEPDIYNFHKLVFHSIER